MMDPDKLEMLVQKMRELGVDELSEGDLKIRLGTAPTPEKREKSRDEVLAEIEMRRRKHHEVQFAACHVVPRLSVVK